MNDNDSHETDRAQDARHASDDYRIFTAANRVGDLVVVSRVGREADRAIKYEEI